MGDGLTLDFGLTTYQLSCNEVEQVSISNICQDINVVLTDVVAIVGVEAETNCLTESLILP